MDKKGQAIYYDLILGIAIFTIVLGIFFYNFNVTDKKELENEAIRISESLFIDNDPLNIIDRYELNETKIEILKTKEYRSVQQEIRTGYNFMIYEETPDNKIIGTEYSTAKNIVKIERIAAKEGNLVTIGVMLWQ